jgi:hypothetical protein
MINLEKDKLPSQREVDSLKGKIGATKKLNKKILAAHGASTFKKSNPDKNRTWSPCL